MAMRPPSSAVRAWRSPAPRGPSSASGPTSTPSSVTGRGVAGTPADLPQRRVRAVPGASAGTMNVLISPSPVSAVTVQQAVISVPALVMNIFAPSIRQPPSAGVARVRVAPASDPASGSVSPNAARARPDARSGTQRSRCSGVAEEDDRHRPEARVRRDRDGHRGVNPRQLLDGDGVGERVQAGAAQLLRDGHAHQAQPAEGRDDRVGEAALAVERLGDRRDLALRDLPDGGAEGDLLVRRAPRSPGAPPERGVRRPGDARPPAAVPPSAPAASISSRTTSPIRSAAASTRPGVPSRRAPGPRR